MMQPNLCNSCGQPIMWVTRKDNGRWSRPLDSFSAINGFVVVDGEVHVGTLYQPHACVPNDVNRLINQKRMEDAAQADLNPEHMPSVFSRTDIQTMADEERETKNNHLDLLEQEYNVKIPAWENPETAERRLIRQRDRHQEIADKRRCDYCKAKKGERCWNVTKKLKGELVHSGNAHPEREVPRDKILDRPSPF